MKTSFPRLTQSIVNLPTVTNGWYSIPNIGGLTRFDGTPVRSVPQLRTYFGSDLIPVVEQQQSNFHSLDGTSSVDWVAPLLLIVAIVVILFAVLMIALHLRGGVSRGRASAGAWVVIAVGIGVTALVLVLSLVPRVANGQKLLNALRPVNDAARVQGDRTGIAMVSAIFDTEDPLMTAHSGRRRGAEADRLRLAEDRALAGRRRRRAAKELPAHDGAPRDDPLSSVTAGLPGLLAFLEKTLHVSQAQLLGAMKTSSRT